MMKTFYLVTLFCFFSTDLAAFQHDNKINVIPKPVEVIQGNGFFNLHADVKIVADNMNNELSAIARELKDLIDSAAWTNMELVSEPVQGDTYIIIELTDSDRLRNPEAYVLKVMPAEIRIQASGPQGIFYGMQTLRQLFPPEIEYTDPSLVPNNREWNIPVVEIYDYPRFEYRGMHLDVARHFFPVEFVKKYLDLMALYKMNRFHWHLTEDQGWRIEIEKYPLLTEIGAWRDSTLIGIYGSENYLKKRYGGYYTRDDVREVVEYARSRYITVIPEIEMPGHASAALAAYPELGCFEKEYRVQSTWGVFEDIFCPKEKTFEFLENVLLEVMELFPGTYIHIGGDEVPKKQWEESEIAQEVIQREGLKDEHELQSYFIQRIETFLNSHGRQIIGWDEILEGGLAPRATVMSWRGEAGGIESARMKHDVIMTPNGSNYFDHYQADRKNEPLAIGGFTTLEDVYRYEPIPDVLTEEEATYILGAQGNVWTEYMHSPSKVEYMAYPRVIALAEVVWSARESRDWDDFLKRLQTHFNRLDMIGVNYARHYRE